MVSRPPPDHAVQGAIAFMREAWRGNDGAEGDSVKLVCDELERCRAENHQLVKRLKVIVDSYERFLRRDLTEEEFLGTLAETEFLMRQHPIPDAPEVLGDRMAALTSALEYFRSTGNDLYPHSIDDILTAARDEGWSPP